MANIDAVYGALQPRRCHYLVDAGDIEVIRILVGGNKNSAMRVLHDRNREGEAGPLQKISDELAEVARTLAQIAETDNGPSVFHKPTSFLPAPLGGFQSFGDMGKASATSTIDAKFVRSLIKFRRLRDSFFDAELFADPAWDILLDLMAAGLEGRNVSVSSLCIAAAVPPTTALRWITAMTESGMLLRQQDPADARRVFIILSDEVTAKLNAYFAAADRQNVQIVR